MEPVRIISGSAAPLLRDNVDTDTISPGQRRSQVGKPRNLIHTPAELADLLFSAWRYDDNDEEDPSFILNKPGFRSPSFLLAGKNFGCGSSRETAAEMFYYFGIRCIIAESFSEIFYGNCVKNAVVPVVLPAATIKTMADRALSTDGSAQFRLDLEARTITSDGSDAVSFEMPALRRRQLLEGLDEIEMTLGWEDEIQAYQQKSYESRPWDFPAASS